MAALAPQTHGIDVDATYRRVRAATCDETGFTPDERDEHIRNVTAMIVEAKVRGSLVNRETWRLT